MAAYSGTPTVNSAYELGDRNGKLVGVVRNLTIAISSQGGATNNIPASALGFVASSLKKVVAVNYTDGSAQNRAIFAWTDGNLVLLGDPQVSTDADRGEPLDMTGDLTIEVTGNGV
jgi:hypothetical protein